MIKPLYIYFSQPPPSSSRPPVTGYKIIYNTTGSALITQTSETNFVINGVMPGVYFFTVLAVNVLGDGKEDRMSIVGRLDHVCYTTSQNTSSYSYIPAYFLLMNTHTHIDICIYTTCLFLESSVTSCVCICSILVARIQLLYTLNLCPHCY